MLMAALTQIDASVKEDADRFIKPKEAPTPL
jgi:hypothetical protein